MDAVGWREATERSPALLSALRYPGSKRRMLPVIREVIKANNVSPGVFFEPFAGGASVALQLAYEGIVERIALADLDALITSFWATVFWDTDWLCDQIDNVDVSLETWHRMRESDPRGVRGRAMKCLILNRTSFSGIIGGHPGPIGGQAQGSAYKIDCRFNRRTLKTRIRKAATLASRVDFVRCQTWQQTLRDAEDLSKSNAGIFIYADPPFMNKAANLYRHYFRARQHVALRDALASLQLPWLLSYDAHPKAWNLYSSVPKVVQVEHYYSISKASARRPAWEMLVTNLEHLPAPRPPRPHMATVTADRPTGGLGETLR